jgi:hypothetical protein
MLSIKPVEIYVELNKFFTTKLGNYKNMELGIKELLPKLKSDKTYGLVKICFKNFWANKVCRFLKNYSRISLSKISTALDIESNCLIGIIKLCAYVFYFLFKENKINLRFNEVDEILEIMQSDFEPDRTMEKLKECYKKVNLKLFKGQLNWK